MASQQWARTGRGIRWTGIGGLCRLLCIWALGVATLAVAMETPHPQLLSLIGRHLARDYYDQGRIHPAIMIREALRALEGGHVAINTTWDGERLRLAIGEQAVEVIVSQTDELVGVVRLLTETQAHLAASEQLEPDERRGLIYAMVNGALRTLDPYTVVVPPEPAQIFSETVIDGEFFGVGAYLSSQEGLVRIDQVMPGMPADRAGIADGDIILAIDGETTAGLTLSEAVRRIKGPRGTIVELLVERDDEEQALAIEVVRDRIRPITMRAVRIDDIGYIRMDEFSGPTFTDMRLRLQELRNQDRERPLRGLVLDLRFNTGGRLDQAHFVADLFLPPGRDVVRTVQPGVKPTIHTSSRAMLLDVPMMVLVGANSASAAEILAGALQQNDRAVVAGQTTYGKGSVQTWRPLPDGSFFKYTIQEYQLAGGVSIQGAGVDPDLRLTRHTERENGTIDMVPFRRISEADNEYALVGPGTYYNPSRFNLFWLQRHRPEEIWERHRISHAEFEPDPEARLTMEVLADALAPVIEAAGGTAITLQRQQLLDVLDPAVQLRQAAEADLVAERLQTLDPPVVWGEAPRGDLTADSLLIEVDQSVILSAGDTVTVPVRVTNVGSQDATRLYGLMATEEASPVPEAEALFGVVPAGQTRSAHLRLRLPPRLVTGEEVFQLEIFQQGRPLPVTSQEVVMRLAGGPRPRLGYAWRVEGADGGSVIRLDEAATIHVDIQNDGEAASAPLIAYLRKDDNPFIQLGEARWRLQPLGPGEQVSLAIPVTVRSSLTVGDQTRSNELALLSLSLAIEERFEEGVSHYLRESLYHHLELPLGEPLDGGRIRQPAIIVEGSQVDARGVLELVYRIEDEAPDFVAVFLGEDKVAVEPLNSSDHLQHHRLQLEPGLNRIRIVARNRDGLIAVHPTRLWADPALVEEDARQTIEAMP